MRYGYRVALVFLIGFFIDCINIFMSAIALPAIALAFDVPPSSVTWVANAYILGLTLIIPLSGWLAQRYGARAMMPLSMLIFALAVTLAGRATSFPELISWRFIQGMGGGLLIPIGQALTFSQFKGDQRVYISTIIMAVALIAPAISPTIGGMIVDLASWRWVFFSNVPLSLVAMVLAWVWIKDEAPVQNTQSPDLKGIVLVSLALALALISLSIVGNGRYWTALPIFIASLGCGGWYWRHANQHPSPILNIKLLANTKLLISIVVYYYS